VSSAPGRLFDPDLPDGFHYRDEFLAADEEASLAVAIAGLTFSTFEMRGVAARRRVAFFGQTYNPRGTVSAPLPAFLAGLRERVGRWAGVEPEAFAMALVNEYAPGAPIGWHRDAPQYDIVAGVSLLSACRMKFRPYVRAIVSEARPRRATHETILERRSAYLMTGPSRHAFEHHIPAVTTLRYSVTFRTRRAQGS
jgi:alkylated DNA repair dioxygenase AlkB